MEEILPKIADVLKISKPIIVFKVETTGFIFSEDRIVQLSYLKMDKGPRFKREDLLFDPGVEISPEASQIHGVVGEKILEKLQFRDKAGELMHIFADCVFVGFGISGFDLHFLKREFARCSLEFEYGVHDYIDLLDIFNYMEPRDLRVAYKYYCGKEYKNPNGAASGLDAFCEILAAQFEKYKIIMNERLIDNVVSGREADFGRSSGQIYWKGGEPHLLFAKYHDKPISEVAKNDPNFLEWILNADFSLALKRIIIDSMRSLGIKRKQK